MIVEGVSGISEHAEAQRDSAVVERGARFGGSECVGGLFRVHSIVGVGEKPNPTEPWLPNEPIQTSLCTGNMDTVENEGPVYQELSRLTGGLRFPLCQFTAFDAVFQTIANSVVSQATIACEFDIPPAPGDSELDLSKVAVAYDPGDGSGAKTFGQAMTAAECVPDALHRSGDAQDRAVQRGMQRRAAGLESDHRCAFHV